VAFLGVVLLHLRAQHRAHQAIRIPGPDRLAAGHAAIFEDGDAIGDVEHLVYAVRDVKDGFALPCQLSDEGVQAASFIQPQGRCGLIHDQQG